MDEDGLDSLIMLPIANAQIKQYQVDSQPIQLQKWCYLIKEQQYTVASFGNGSI
jgi:hypothetical protein